MIANADTVICDLCEQDARDNGTPSKELLRTEAHFFVAYEPTAVLYTICKDCAEDAEDCWVHTVDSKELVEFNERRVTQGLPALTDIQIVQQLADETEGKEQ